MDFEIERSREGRKQIDPIGFLRAATPQLRLFVSQQQGSLAPAHFVELISNIKDAADRFTAKLLAVSPGIERAMLLHRIMDRELKPASDLPVSCRKGCSGCCHYEVEVTQDEGILLAQLVIGGFPLDLERLEVQAQRERKSPEWGKFVSKDNRCVFLGSDGACQVYDYRPAICRKHLVVSPPEACTTEGAQVIPVNIPLSEILLSSALSIEGASHASLSKMLTRALKARV
jgi:Fe-S-cluster containining protein